MQRNSNQHSLGCSSQSMGLGLGSIPIIGKDRRGGEGGWRKAAVDASSYEEKQSKMERKGRRKMDLVRRWGMKSNHKGGGTAPALSATRVIRWMWDDCGLGGLTPVVVSTFGRRVAYDHNVYAASLVWGCSTSVWGQLYSTKQSLNSIMDSKHTTRCILLPVKQ